MDGCIAIGAVKESTWPTGVLVVVSSPSMTDLPTDRNAPSRRTPPGNQARFIYNNPAIGRRCNDVLLLSNRTKATPPFTADVRNQ